MIDIGANVLNAAFDADRDEVLQRAFAAGVEVVVVTGTNVAASRAAAAFAKQHGMGSPTTMDAVGRSVPRIFSTAGVHPHDAATVDDGWATELAAMAACPEVVAIGETGLDYFRNYSPRAEQREVFRRQIELAVEAGKPLFVHDRDSAGETRDILADYRGDLTACVIHCFTGTAGELEGYLEDGYHIGVTGWICDERRGRELMELAPHIPAERLMIETDAPYLLPRSMDPRPPTRRNEPAFLTWIARQVAACRREEVSRVERQTHTNAERFFRLP